MNEKRESWFNPGTARYGINRERIDKSSEPVPQELVAYLLTPEQVIVARDKEIKLAMEGKTASFLFTVCEAQLAAVKPLVDRLKLEIKSLEAQVKSLEAYVNQLKGGMLEAKREGG